MSDIPYVNDRCPYCGTPYGDDRDENGRLFCDCLEAENKRLIERLANVQSELEQMRRLRNIVAKVKEWTRGDNYDSRCMLCGENWPGPHEPDCFFANEWEAR